MKKHTIPLILVLLLSACGFHLRGMVDIPLWLDSVAIISNDGNKPFEMRLESGLEAYKIKVIPEPAQAHYWLIINKSNLQQHIISVGASTNPRQYQLIMTIEFQLQSNTGKIIQPSRQIMVTRQFTVNNDRILGSNEEEATLISEMQQEAVIQIINRLSHKGS